MIGRLVSRGLLGKVRDPQDGRRFLLRLTEEGERVQRRLAVRAARMNQVFLGPLSAEDRDRLRAALSRLDRHLVAIGPDAAAEAEAEDVD